MHHPPSLLSASAGRAGQDKKDVERKTIWKEKMIWKEGVVDRQEGCGKKKLDRKQSWQVNAVGGQEGRGKQTYLDRKTCFGKKARWTDKKDVDRKTRWKEQCFGKKALPLLSPRPRRPARHPLT